MKEARERFSRYLHRCYGDRSTPKHYLNDLDLFIGQAGEQSAASITVKNVDEFVDSQLEANLKPATINRRVAPRCTLFSSIWPVKNQTKHGRIQSTDDGMRSKKAKVCPEMLRKQR